jgi:hypothetical protein
VVTSAGTIDSFRDGETIGVVGEPNVAVEHPTQVCFNLPSVEPGGTCPFRYPGTRVD